MLAVYLRKIVIIKYLIERDADVNKAPASKKENPLYLANLSKNIENLFIYYLNNIMIRYYNN